MNEQEFITATKAVLEAKYHKERCFPYPWQFDELPTDLRQRYWALKAIVSYLRTSRVNQQLRDTWAGVLGKVAVEYADTLAARDEIPF